jgi:GlpG protein
MRLIGHLADETAARRFGDYLYVQGIDNEVEEQPSQGWAVWINDEDKINGAALMLQRFRTDPGDPKYAGMTKEAAQLRAQGEESEAAHRKKLRHRRDLFRPMTSYGFGPLTFALIAASVAVFILSKFGSDHQSIMDLFIADYSSGEWDRSLPEIRHGQIWRLVTPIFIHYGALHIIFNMLWLRDLGSMIEGRQSTLHLAILVLVIACCSNLAQFYLGGGPMFGGMSGVVYGLLGYIWIRGKFDAGSGLYLHPSTVWMMLLWFFACLFNIIPHVANVVHAVGLVMGMGWGFVSSRFRSP